MSRLPALLLATCLVSLLACEPASGPRSANDGRGTSIVEGGRVVFGLLGEPASYEPYSRNASDLTYFLAASVYPSLFDAGPDGPLPDLASAWQLHDGAVTITLRRAAWSDGRPITALDVVRSVDRARPPSGLALMTTARATGPHSVRLTSRLATRTQWADALARGSVIEPRDARSHPLMTSGGPFEVEKLRPGLGIDLVPNPQWFGDAPHLDSISIRFTDATDIMLELLRGGRLDAAAPPSTVNLADRLDEMGLDHEGVRGSELVYLDLGGSAPDRDLRAATIEGIDARPLQAAFVRDEGALVDAGRLEVPRDHPSAQIAVGAPTGDELLQLMLRLMQRQLQRDNFQVDLVGIDARSFYGSWETTDPIDVALRREIVADGPDDVPADLGRYPLFSVDSFVAWRAQVHGLAPSGTLSGPLWNTEDWWRE